jgi:hypothetical protein
MILLSSCGLTACYDPLAPHGPAVVLEEILPDTIPAYARWYEDMQACSGLPELPWPTIYVMASPIYEDGWRFPCKSGMCAGVWKRRPKWVIIAPAHTGTDWNAKIVVSHELLHHLLDDTGHPPIFEECGV